MEDYSKVALLQMNQPKKKKLQKKEVINYD